MVPTATPYKDPIDPALPAAEARFVQDLAGRLYERATPAFMAEAEADLSAIAQEAARFIEERSPGRIKIRAFNPTRDKEGWESAYTAVMVGMEDRPFIVDSVRAELRRHGMEPQHVLHPIIRVERDTRGRLKRRGGFTRGLPEVCQLYLVERQDDPRRLEAVTEALEEVLRAVVSVTDDFQAMRSVLRGLRDALRAAPPGLGADEAQDAEETAQFLDWLDADNFVFLGCTPDAVGAPALGLLRPGHHPWGLAVTPPVDLPRPTGTLPELRVLPSDAASPVNRPTRMDWVRVPAIEDGGVRFVWLLGQFTSQATAIPAREIPVLRRRLREVLAMDGAPEGSHDYHRLIAVFNGMPRAELFCSDVPRLHADIRSLLLLEGEMRPRLCIRAAALGRGLLATLVLPRARYSEAVRAQVHEAVAEHVGAPCVSSTVGGVDENEAAVHVHVFAFVPGWLQGTAAAALETIVMDRIRTWEDRLAEAAAARRGEAEAARLARRGAALLPPAYQSATPAAVALGDLELLEAPDPASIQVRLSDSDTGCRLAIHHRRSGMALNDTVPILENLGLRVLGQNFYELTEGPDGPTRLDVFRIEGPEGRALDVEAAGERLVHALQAILAGEADSDRLNALVLAAGLTARQVALLRTLCRYHAQLDATAARRHDEAALLAHPASARALHGCFEARFAPGVEDRAGRWTEARDRFLETLGEVGALAHDRALRSLLNLVEATVRTNFHADRPWISLKVRSGDVEVMPAPRPLFEIFVDAPGMQGIHLRGGRVARGGLRWSDRPDDFRTEVLGLMKTQMTKNTVIVPVGSKGGFVLKPPHTGPTCAVEQYRIFIRGLLDLTDNIVDGRVTPPAGLVIHDEPDPYLVVAADKGTATFSDIANGVAEEHGFWLGDAFASGGSRGYDHKKEGITARGAWESVKQHFREKGLDWERQPFTVAGVGDMAGDVFGNGMCYAATIRLQAAFNHAHVFLDPDPDPKASYQERRRLFALPRSTWEDYDRSLISRGGGVFSRQAKSIALSPEARDLLGIEAETASGEAVVRAILQMPVDLLWNGGIGTYVKSSTERHADVGDPGNDPVRIDATMLRARVVAEGGNQGLTQQARIEYARRGGRICTDAVDNSAGVDTSDHEVNLKIMLQPLVACGELTAAQRNEALARMKDDVIALVLQDNRRQTLALALEEARSKRDLALYASHMGALEQGALNRGVESLPDAQALLERARTGEGLTRPELAVLLAYTKMALYEKLLASELPDDPMLEHHLFDYFPPLAREPFAAAIRGHRLRREIAATQMCNRIADGLGMTFVHRIVGQTGADETDVLRTVLASLELLDVGRFLHRLFLPEGPAGPVPAPPGAGAWWHPEASVPPRTQGDAIEKAVAAVEHMGVGLLQSGPPRTGPEAIIVRYQAVLRRLLADLEALLPPADLARFQQVQVEAQQANLPAADTTAVACLELVPALMGIADVARRADAPLDEAASHYFAVGQRLSLRWLREALARLGGRDRWERIALSAAAADLQEAQCRLAVASIEGRSVDHSPLAPRFDAALREVCDAGPLTLAAIQVLVRLLGSMDRGRG